MGLVLPDAQRRPLIHVKPPGPSDVQLSAPGRRIIEIAKSGEREPAKGPGR
jgi:hypothetical protein